MDSADEIPVNARPPRERPTFLHDETPVDATQAATGANHKILIVDDDPIVVRAFELKLKRCGFNVITTTDFTQGISAARREKPEVIILDLNFPPGESFTSLNWNGLHILQWLKRYNEVSNIPVIIVTAGDPGNSKDAALSAGAAAFFQKPVDLKTFLAELLKLISDKPRA